MLASSLFSLILEVMATLLLVNTALAQDTIEFPSSMPSSIPSGKPSSVPSGNPSSVPTASLPPSILPSSAPSTNPTQGPLRVPEIFSEFDENFGRLVLQAAQLSAAVNKVDTLGDLPIAARIDPLTQIFIDEPYKALVTKIDDICFLAFRGKSFSSTEELVEGFAGQKTDEVCTGQGSSRICCTTLDDFEDAIFDASYRKQLDDALETCLDSCISVEEGFFGSTNTDSCELVLTGFSQGGAIAQVAAAAVSDVLSPTTITFGQPPTLEAPCPLVNGDRTFRFINTDNVNGVDLQYDPVPYSVNEINFATQFGQAFILGEDTSAIKYYEDGAAPIVGFANWFLPEFLTIHDADRYASRVEELVSTAASFPISLNGFGLGNPCTSVVECVEPLFCSQGICSLTGGRVGDPCTSSLDCTFENTCSGVRNRRCEAKRPNGSVCSESDDCISGVCLIVLFRGRCVD